MDNECWDVFVRKSHAITGCAKRQRGCLFIQSCLSTHGDGISNVADCWLTWSWGEKKCHPRSLLAGWPVCLVCPELDAGDCSKPSASLGCFNEQSHYTSYHSQRRRISCHFHFLFRSLLIVIIVDREANKVIFREMQLNLISIASWVCSKFKNQNGKRDSFFMCLSFFTNLLVWVFPVRVRCW